MRSRPRDEKADTQCLVLVLCIVSMCLFLRSAILLIRNESRNIQRITDLQEGRDSVIEIDLYNNNFSTTTTTNNSSNDNNNISSSLDGQLIYFVGDLSTTDQLIDPLFGVEAASNDYNTTNITSALATFSFLKIQRSVQMYQWLEIKHTGKHGATYTYEKQWSSQYSDSSRFVKRSSSRMNPNFPPFQSQTFIADPFNFGNTFDLTDDATLAALSWYEPLNTISIDDVPNGTDIQVSQLTKYIPNGFLYSQSAPSSASHSDRPNIGDVHVTWGVIRPSTVSVVAQFHPAMTNQNGTSSGRHNLGPYTTRHGGTILIVQNGLWTMEELFQMEVHIQNTKVWKYRRNGFIWMCAAMLCGVLVCLLVEMVKCWLPKTNTNTNAQCILNCLLTLFLPILEVALVCMLLALPICIYFIAFANVAFRPKIAIPVVVSMSIISMAYTYYWCQVNLHRVLSLVDSLRRTNKDENAAVAAESPELHDEEIGTIPNDDKDSAVAAVSSEPHEEIGTNPNDVLLDDTVISTVDAAAVVAVSSEPHEEIGPIPKADDDITTTIATTTEVKVKSPRQETYLDSTNVFAKDV
jgi:Transmembrane protein 43